MLEELLEFCQSESLSEDGLQEIIQRSIDYEFFHKVCLNEKVTEGVLRCLIKYFPNAVRHADAAGRLPLHIICDNKNVTLGMVQLLIDAFPESVRHETNRGGWIPLHFLCRNKNLDDEVGLDILKLFLDRYPESVRHANELGTLPIHIAAGKQSAEFCRILIEAYPGSERITNNSGFLPFNVACTLNTVATAKYFYQLYPESINAADNNGHHPIYHAILDIEKRSNLKEGIEVLRFLLDCNPVALGSTGQTPLHFICRNKYVTLSVVQLLLDAFPDSVHHEDHKGFTPLHKLCLNKNRDEEVGLKILKLFVERCPESVRHVARDGRLPIHFAAAYQSPEFCRMLIEAYPGSERMADVGDQLPFHAACQRNTVATAKYLYQLYPESINVADNGGYHPIHHAIMGLKYRKNNPEAAIEIVQFLLHCDPNVVSQKQSGKLTLYLVCREATHENTPKLNAYLKVLRILYDAYPEAIDEVASDVGSFCLLVQTVVRTHLVYARQARDRTVMTTRDQNGQLPLHIALSDNVTLGSIKLLVKGNPSAVRTPDNAGALPLHLACRHQESASIVEYLIGLDQTTLQAVDEKGNTVLHYACRGAKHATISLLLDKYGGLSVSRRNAHYRLPIHLLLESKEVSDREDTKYVESIYRLLRAYPETVMGEEESKSEDCLPHRHSGKKRKLGSE